MSSEENPITVKNIIEALLIISENGLSREELAKVIGDTTTKEVGEGIDALKEEYSSSNRSFNIAEIAGKCRIVTKPEFMPWISNLYQPEPDRLSGPGMETLAIIAYKQPVTRAEIEFVRGVNVGGVLKTLLDKNLIKVKGRKDVAGKPLIYGTTEKFLELFGLNSLNDLPVLREFKEEDLEFSKEEKEEIVALQENSEATGEDQSTSLPQEENSDTDKIVEDVSPVNENDNEMQ